MKSKSIILFSFLFLAFGLSINSCKKNGSCKQKNVSTNSEDSHNSGKNCMQCHTSGGEGEGCFNAAGSMFSSTGSALPGGTVQFYTSPNGGGSLKYTVNVDQSGNFYTTDNMTLTGLYPVAVGPNGTSKYMGSSISSGACNSCHGNTTGKIWSY